MKRRSIHKKLKKNTFYCDLRGGTYDAPVIKDIYNEYLKKNITKS